MVRQVDAGAGVAEPLLHADGLPAGAAAAAVTMRHHGRVAERVVVCGHDG
jgi:hypothetical protein